VTRAPRNQDSGTGQYSLIVTDESQAPWLLAVGGAAEAPETLDFVTDGGAMAAPPETSSGLPEASASAAPPTTMARVAAMKMPSGQNRLRELPIPRNLGPRRPSLDPGTRSPMQVHIRTVIEH
jgi:hypothetical protein